MIATAPTRHDVERYLALPYRIELTPDDSEWVVKHAGASGLPESG